ncbi:cell adhesion molecule CEACAM3-like [Macrotis lagotis]|uniref:cell adhesion molecule CEACAM3-like n=1 Tax=Macrotis lagotis TaxID=92651 RepID=UPI003D682C37
MESPSEATHYGGSPWKRLLITASILSCWIQSASAQGAPITIVPNPPYGTVGDDVILDIHEFSGQAYIYTWYRNSVEEKNRIVFYHVPSANQYPDDIREKVFSNGSMLIPNLSLNDTENYSVLIVDSMGLSRQASGHLSVYARRNDILISGGSIIGIVIGVLAGVILIGGLIYFLFFRKTGRARKHYLSEKNHSAPKHGEDTTLYENTAYLKDSALPVQGLGSSSTSPEVQTERIYQTLDITKVHVYDKIIPKKNPQT